MVEDEVVPYHNNSSQDAHDIICWALLAATRSISASVSNFLEGKQEQYAFNFRQVYLCVHVDMRLAPFALPATGTIRQDGVNELAICSIRTRRHIVWRKSTSKLPRRIGHPPRRLHGDRHPQGLETCPN